MPSAKPLTRREKAALTLAALYEVQGLAMSWLDTYLIAIDRPTNDAIITVALKGRAATWKNSAKVQDFFRVEVDRLRTWVKQARRTTGDNEPDGGDVGECVADEPKRTAKRTIDYTNKEVALAELNKLAASAKDDKTKLEIMKLIGDFQQFKQAPGAEDADMKRFYMPLRCSECQLYMNAAANLAVRTE